MAKIYVSSTYLDLQDYRAQLEKVIRRMGHIDVAMEYYVAEDIRPVAKCLKDVAECDVYIGIFAWRYGWQPKDDNPDQLSITEMEFRQAERFGKPCLIFLLSDDAPWPRKFMDKDITRIEMMRGFVSARHTTDFFLTADELARKVAEAIYKQIPPSVSFPEHNLDSYYAALRKRYNILALEGLTPPQKEEYLQIQLSSIFIEQSVRENPPPVELPKEIWEKLSSDKEILNEDLPTGLTLDDIRRAREGYYKKPSLPILDVLIDTRYQHIIILGDPGSGKSTFARYVMLSFIDPDGNEKLRRAFQGYLPILIELRSYVGLCSDGMCNNFLEFLVFLGETEGWHLTKAGLYNHLKNIGEALVIFDGLDEIFDPEQRERVTRQIVGFCNDYPKVRVVVTSRVIGYRRKILADAGFAHFTLQDLDERQVEAFITHWYDLAMSDRLDDAKERRERILKSFKDSASIRQLAGNPMLLTIMAIIGKHQELPRERWKLYDHAASVLIQHWDINKHLKDKRIEADFIGEDDKKELLRRLAFRMQSGDDELAGNYIHHDVLQNEFESYLIDRYKQTPERAKTIAQVMIQQFRERNFILSLYGGNLYGFVHRAFLEYFCATAIVWKFEKTKELTIEELKIDVYGKHWQNQSWNEVLRLICGTVDEKWAAQILQYLSKDVFDVLSISSDSEIPWNISLGIQCLQEIRNLNSMGAQARKLLQDVFFLFDRKMTGSSPLYIFLEKTVIPSLQAIGMYYPERHVIVEWLVKRKSHTNNFTMYGELFGSLIEAIGKDLDDVYQVIIGYLKSKGIHKRYLALFALAQAWPNHPDTFNILVDRAFNEKSDFISFVAAYCAGTYFRSNPKSFELALELSTRDIMSRMNAIYILGEYFFLNPRTFTTIRDVALNDEYYAARAAAIDQLKERFSDNPQTLQILHTCAIKDASPEADDPDNGFFPRKEALEAIAQKWPTDPKTISILKYCVLNDPTPWLRDKAKGWVEELEKAGKINIKQPSF